MRDKFSAVRWLAVVVYGVGLAFDFFAGNFKLQPLFTIAAGGLACFDSFATTPRPTLSLLDGRADAKPKFRPSPLMLSGFALLLASLI